MKTWFLGSLVAAGCFSMACGEAVSNDSFTGAGGSNDGAGGAGQGVGGENGLGTGGTTFGSTGGTTFGSTGGTTFGAGGTPGGASGGAPATATGGVPGASGGAPATATGGTTSAGTECEVAPIEDGYYGNGTLCGYAWTAANDDGGDIEPPCGSGECFLGTTLCATADIPPNEDPLYPGVMIGWNVAQARGASTVPTWEASGTGITVDFTATGATGDVRLMVQVGSTDYCLSGAVSGKAYSWSDFVVGCWEGGPGTPALAAGAEIKAIGVQVAGEDAAQTVTALCLEGVTNN